MPPTTGGSTSGSSTSERSSRWPGNDVRASTSAIGTPRTTQSTVLRPPRSAGSAPARPGDDSEVTSGTKSRPVDPREPSRPAAAPRTPPPATAGTYSQRGRPDYGRGRSHRLTAWPKPAAARTCWPSVAGHQSTNCLASPCSCSSASGRDRVDVHRLGRLRERDALDLVAGAFHVGDIDEPGVGLPADDLAEHVGHRLLLADRLQVDPAGLLDLLRSPRRTAPRVRRPRASRPAWQVLQRSDAGRVVRRDGDLQGVGGEVHRGAVDQVVRGRPCPCSPCRRRRRRRPGRPADLGDQVGGAGEAEGHRHPGWPASNCSPSSVNVAFSEAAAKTVSGLRCRAGLAPTALVRRRSRRRRPAGPRPPRRSGEHASHERSLGGLDDDGGGLDDGDGDRAELQAELADGFAAHQRHHPEGPALQLDLGHHLVDDDAGDQADEPVARRPPDLGRVRHRGGLADCANLRELVAVDDLAAGCSSVSAGSVPTLDPAPDGVVADTEERGGLPDPNLRHGPTLAHADLARTSVGGAAPAAGVAGPGPVTGSG